MNGSAPATKQHTADLKAEIKVDIKAEIDQLRTERRHQFDDLKKALRDSETKLLQAFYGYAASNDKRLAQNEANVAVFLSRISTLETRLFEVEKRLNILPAA